jgi:hypothetical protein
MSRSWPAGNTARKRPSWALAQRLARRAGCQTAEPRSLPAGRCGFEFRALKGQSTPAQANGLGHRGNPVSDGKP